MARIITHWQWVTQQDETMCDNCNAMHGKLITVDQVKYNASILPPLHESTADHPSGCRCYIVPRYKWIKSVRL
jgi:hypothetical protein